MHHALSMDHPHALALTATLALGWSKLVMELVFASCLAECRILAHNSN